MNHTATPFRNKPARGGRAQHRACVVGERQARVRCAYDPSEDPQAFTAFPGGVP
mgnify:CR=1 FL=1